MFDRLLNMPLECISNLWFTKSRNCETNEQELSRYTTVNIYSCIAYKSNVKLEYLGISQTDRLIAQHAK